MVQIHRLYDILELKRQGVWQEYRKESNHQHDLEEELAYCKDFCCWIAVDKNEIVGFVLTMPSEFDMEHFLLLTSMWIKPGYRGSDIDRRLATATEFMAKILGCTDLGVFADNERIAKYVARRHRAEKIYYLLTRKVGGKKTNG